MTLVRWDPFGDFFGWSDRALRLLQGTGEEASGAWIPATDIVENPDGLVIRAELPGVDRKNIDVSVENGLLRLRGTRERESEIEKRGAHRLERVYGRFVRTFALPETVDASRVEATYRDGILELVVPRTEKARPRRVEIRAA